MSKELKPPDYRIDVEDLGGPMLTRVIKDVANGIVIEGYGIGIKDRFIQKRLMELWEAAI